MTKYETTAIELDPNNKDFESNVDKMYTQPINETLKSVNKEFEGFRVEFTENAKEVLTGLKRISKPGRRVYVGKEEVPQVLSGLGVAVISTSKGLMTDNEAREAGVGGEFVCEIW
ncbi:MAG: 30S ribosomal protein S8 [Nitrospinaceae bacterium]|nr:30S ribosomal protein S8 [Nitrospinaceae bacterium]